MTHFVGLVVAETEAELAALLQPFHEYECTGIEDEFVVDHDDTEENRADYVKHDEGRDFLEWVQDWTGREVTRNLDGPFGRSVIVLDDESEVVKTICYTNPNNKWDWWVVGGRWSEMVPCHNCLVEAVSRHFPDWQPSVLVDASGWHAAKDWGWFGSSSPSDTPDVMQTKLAEHAGKRVWVVDFHI